MIKKIFKFLWKSFKIIGLFLLFLILIFAIIMLSGEKIYVELFVILIPVIILITGMLWKWSSKKKLLEQYNPEDDKSKKGGERLGSFGGRERETQTATEFVSRFKQPSRRKLLQTAASDSTRKDSLETTRTDRSNKRNVRSLGKLLKRRRRIKK